jgi:hypothetical protein
MRTSVAFAFVVTILCSLTLHAESSPQDSRIDEIRELLREQEDELRTQRALIIQQNQRIDVLQAELDDMKKPDVFDTGKELPSLLDTEAVAAKPEPDGRTAEAMVASTKAEQIAEKQALADSTIEESNEAQEDDPTRAILEALPGAMRLPGTNAVMRWGGFVKASYVQSFDPLAITDRFITGAIPTSDVAGVEESDLTVSQSRMSFDLREPTSVGLLRGYIEADFADENDTLRLRHAFGQRGDVLVGKTWSGFVDRTASPEEIDFEGLNGRINVRQAQVRFQPRIGRRFEMAMSLEDPAPRVTGGKGVSKIPDLVVSGRLNFGEDIHLRIAGLFRQVRGQWDVIPSVTDEELGWGLSVSGRFDAQRWDGRDKILFQINAGKGYGRYVNDLRSVGDFDGVFSPTGELELIDVLSGYVSGQHWWGSTMRSTLTFGFVKLDSPEFVPDEFYKQTFRASGNLIWSPTPRIDVGGELLWGRRTTEDDSSGEALQFQMAMKYLF